MNWWKAFRLAALALVIAHGYGTCAVSAFAAGSGGLIPHDHSSAGKGGATLSPSTITATNTGDQVVVSRGIATRGRVHMSAVDAAAVLSVNVNQPQTAQDDPAKPSWIISINGVTDDLKVWRSPPGSLAFTNMLTLDAAGKMSGISGKYFGRIHQGSFSTGSLAAGALFSTLVTHGLGSDDVHVIISVAGGDNYMAVATRPDASDTIFRGGQNTTARITGSTPAAGQVNIGIYNDAAGAVTYTVYYTIIGK